MRNRNRVDARSILTAAMLSAALVAACTNPPPPLTPVMVPLDSPVDAGPKAPLMPLREDHPNAPDSVNACVDAWLGRHALNEYGDATGTMYPGGTPLFNERTGKRIDRMDYLFAKNAQLRADCAPQGKR